MLKGHNKQKLTYIAEAIIEFMEDDGMEENEIKEVNFKMQEFGIRYMKEFE